MSLIPSGATESLMMPPVSTCVAETCGTNEGLSYYYYYYLLLRVKQANLEFLEEMVFLEKKEFLAYQESRCVCVCVVWIVLFIPCVCV